MLRVSNTPTLEGPHSSGHGALRPAF
jgi:hypothetical protein